jgi:hypothetical protein
MRWTRFQAGIAAGLGTLAAALSVSAAEAPSDLEVLPSVDEPAAVAPWTEAAPPSIVPTPESLGPVVATPSCESCSWWPSVSPSMCAARYRSVFEPSSRGFGALDCVPNMIGDGGPGTNVAFDGLLEATLAMSQLGTSRLSVADANSPLPTERLYYSYRHLNNASSINVHGFSEAADRDQHVLAWENAFLARAASLEIRVPIEHRTPDRVGSVIDIDSAIIDPIVQSERAELGNISLLFKLLLVEQSWYAMSAGLGVTLPTSEGFNWATIIDGEVAFRDAPGLTADQLTVMSMAFDNETVYLSPFLAWVVTPHPRWFHQGFLQIETAANPSQVVIDGLGEVVFRQNGAQISDLEYETLIGTFAEVHPETLLRLNLGGGYTFAEGVVGAGIMQLSAILELHYTAILSDAKMQELPIDDIDGNGPLPFDSILAGNDDSLGDMVNIATGVSARWGEWLMTNGVIVPLRESPDRAYDASYNLQLQRMF